MRLTLSAIALPLALAAAGCVTRTVYVRGDDTGSRFPRPQATASSTPSQAPPTAGVQAAPAAAEGSVEEQAGIYQESDFYQPLSPYGRWVAYPGYGQVFVPATAIVGAGFRPYTHGHWENTEYGYTWVDHHPFGWATGHYGRWFYDSAYGWAWVPGRTWAPSWVSWRSGGGYVGWAPMPPGAFFGGGYTVYDTSWVYVRTSSFGYGYIGSSLIVGSAYHGCYGSTYPARDTYVVYGRRSYRGPREDDIERGGGRVIHRPVRDIDNERPVTRPPTGTARSRERTRSTATANAVSDEGTQGSARSRDEDRDGGRDGGRSEARANARSNVADNAQEDVRRPSDERTDRELSRGDLIDGRASSVEERVPTVIVPRSVVIDDTPNKVPQTRDDAGDHDVSPLTLQPVGPAIEERVPVLSPSTTRDQSFDRAPARPTQVRIDRAPSSARIPSIAPSRTQTLDRVPTTSRTSTPTIERNPVALSPRAPAVSQPAVQVQPEEQPASKKDAKKPTSKGKAKAKPKR